MQEGIYPYPKRLIAKHGHSGDHFCGMAPTVSKHAATNDKKLGETP
jgi:hypothetical protein